jgi:His-Xaa-Ser system radical SAM maturase HxsC
MLLSSGPLSMIPLTLKLDRYEGPSEPFALRVEAGRLPPFARGIGSLEENSRDRLAVHFNGGNFGLETARLAPQELSGDVLLVFPERRRAIRLIRRQSNSNTILLTEECDQGCVMCSQPPRPQRHDHFELYRQAVELAPPKSVIGISGGEPTLQKAALFDWLRRLKAVRPDVSFHVLTNGQHFDIEDLPALTYLRDVVLWGVPLYAPGPALHDELVGKKGAYARVLQTLDLLGRAGAMVELRTVVMQPNLAVIPRLASFVTTHLRWIAWWAIMQMECRGYARLHWRSLFVDTSRQFAPIAAAIRIAELAELHVALFNFPRCTVPAEYRSRTERSISDWKRRYLAVCERCTQQEACAGFFQWHPADHGFEGLAAL